MISSPWHFRNAKQETFVLNIEKKRWKIVFEEKNLFSKTRKNLWNLFPAPHQFTVNCHNNGWKCIAFKNLLVFVVLFAVKAKSFSSVSIIRILNWCFKVLKLIERFSSFEFKCSQFCLLESFSPKTWRISPICVMIRTIFEAKLLQPKGWAVESVL